MRVIAAAVTSLFVTSTRAFVPHSFIRQQHHLASTTARSFGIDPSWFHSHLQPQLQELQNAFGSIQLADAIDAVDPDAAAAAASGNGWFGFLTGPISSLLQGIHTALVGVGMSADAWGVSIIALTILIKLLTFPLTKVSCRRFRRNTTLYRFIHSYMQNLRFVNARLCHLPINCGVAII
jgi:membrane protein insertase Oxa1/YidC/SpoIIIJ